ncbi:flagellar basal body L-ring protein FlgH [Paremcibacter congregatus]|uniref:Flagellar L-ring protein n=1 Tax=Paremcibacter congregatus TaxID=2043170 RepID=A0A2G4YM12_9PROT|nr:flagellar basal body L-ring protein FlgH [Paremcibacter congregatus]PHZ83338.1 flagellar basal body L-ring protein [Paremcibacter congregatus]QDE28189.1 flagellar basal body L-ring protein FlgH [Paremcibacter congregatus]
MTYFNITATALKGHSRPFLMLVLAFTLPGCSAIDRIGDIGKAPDLAPIEATRVVPQQALASQHAIQHAPVLQQRHENTKNSLWQVGSKNFFKDQRASSVGDILTINITVDDKASIDNQTTRTRSNSDNANAANFLGLESKLGAILPDAVDPSALVNMGSSTSNVGTGKVDRSESINLTLAAVVTQVLPNGNMLVQGRQEVRVNFEVRELTVVGVIRPEDISSSNTIEHTQIAEARISYGGRGQLTDVQQARYGSQLFDILFPF